MKGTLFQLTVRLLAFKVIKLFKFELHYSILFASLSLLSITFPSISDHCRKPLVLSQVALLAKIMLFLCSSLLSFQIQILCWISSLFMIWPLILVPICPPLLSRWLCAQSHLIRYWLSWKHWSFEINWSHHVFHAGKHFCATTGLQFLFSALEKMIHKTRTTQCSCLTYP